MIRALLSAAAVLAAPSLAAASAPRAPAAPSEEIRIPFVDFGGVRSFEVWSDDVVYLQDRRKNWYRAELYGPCFGLMSAIRIGIDSRGGTSFDRFSRLIVDGQSCAIASLTRSEKPVKPWKKKKSA